MHTPRVDTAIRKRLAASTKGRKEELDPVLRMVAKRTAFVARFIVLREGRRTRAHRAIEAMSWNADTTAEELYKRFREAFSSNGDKLQPVDRDLKRALEHAEYSSDYFADQYLNRQTLSFTEALGDYERSNLLLFGESKDGIPRSGGWRVPSQSDPSGEKD